MTTSQMRKPVQRFKPRCRMDCLWVVPSGLHEGGWQLLCLSSVDLLQVLSRFQADSKPSTSLGVVVKDNKDAYLGRGTRHHHHVSKLGVLSTVDAMLRVVILYFLRGDRDETYFSSRFGPVLTSHSRSSLLGFTGTSLGSDCRASKLVHPVSIAYASGTFVNQTPTPASDTVIRSASMTPCHLVNDGRDYNHSRIQITGVKLVTS